LTETPPSALSGPPIATPSPAPTTTAPSTSSPTIPSVATPAPAPATAGASSSPAPQHNDINPAATSSPGGNKTGVLLLGLTACCLVLSCLVFFLVRRRFRKPAALAADIEAPAPSETANVERVPRATAPDPLHNPHFSVNPSKWCITQGQLRTLLDEVEQVYPNEDPNVYRVVEDIIKPRTQTLGESYALLLNPQGVDIKHFVTHAWGEGFKQFAQDLLDLLGTDTSGGLWICFLANPQTWQADDLDSLLGSSPWQSPFAIALSEAESVIAVRNPNVNMYTRLWCVFELYLAHTRGKRVDAVGPQAAICGGELVGFAAKCSVERDARRLRKAMTDCASEVNAWTEQMMKA